MDTSAVGLQAFQDKKMLPNNNNIKSNNSSSKIFDVNTSINNITGSINEDGDDNTMNVEGDIIDDYILHFYDLSIQKPHFLYLFTKIR